MDLDTFQSKSASFANRVPNENFRVISFGTPSTSTASKESTCVGCASTSAIKVHYGAPSCHGCKAFFRRSVFETRVYKCRVGNNCDVQNESRNRCRACRFRKCLSGGMNPRQVREERTKQDKPIRRSPEISSSEQEGVSTSTTNIPTTTVPNTSHYQSNQLAAFLGALDRQIEAICDGNQSDGTGEFRRDISVICGLQDPCQVLQRSPIRWRWERFMSSEDLYTQFYRAFVLHADWAMAIPDYRVLPLEDQTQLFKQNFSGFGWIWYAYRCYEHGMDEVGIPLGNGAYIPYRNEEQAKMDQRFIPTYGVICKKLIDLVVKPMRELQMTAEEAAIVKALALFQPDCPLSDTGKESCRRMTDRLLEALSEAIECCFPHLTRTQQMMRSSRITLLLTSLTHIGQLESTLIQNLNSADLNQLSGVPMELLRANRSPYH